MGDAPNPAAVTVRPAVPKDADGITRVYIESAEHHARLDPERYWIPPVAEISSRYREGRQHPPDAGAQAITLVAELGGEIVGFVDVQLDHSPDPMFRESIYCYVAEIAVSSRHQSQGIGAQLMQVAEEWGRRQGVSFAALNYLANNTRAASFYRRQGYGVAAIKAIKRL